MQIEILKNSIDKLKWNNKKFKQSRRRQDYGEREECKTKGTKTQRSQKKRKRKKTKPM